MCLSVGAQLATVGRVPGEVRPASVPAYSGVCLGLAGRPLLDVSLHHRQRHAAVGSGGLCAMEPLDKSQVQVHAVGGGAGAISLVSSP